MEEQDSQRPSKRVCLSIPTDDIPVEVSEMSEAPGVSQPPILTPNDHQVMTDIPETRLPGLGTVDFQDENMKEDTSTGANVEASVLSEPSDAVIQPDTLTIDEPLTANNMTSDQYNSNAVIESQESLPIKPIKIEGDELDQLPARNAPADQATDTGIASTKAEDEEDGFVMVTGESESAADLPVQEGSIKSEDVEDEREFETDSSPYESSDEDDSSDELTSDEDEDDDDKFKPLTREEAARMLMQDEGGSDDEGGAGKPKPASNVKVKTMHEEVDEPIEMPDLEITPEMQIAILGTVENIVEGMVLIKAKATGEYQVLEPSSVLCTSERKLLGVIAETMGQVQQPYYVLRFKDKESIIEAGVTIGQEIYYVPSHSEFVFTKALQAVKGSDASNFYDEEVAADEIEFSDDEAEAEYKRRKKMRNTENAANPTRGRTKRGGATQYQPSGLGHATYAADTEMNYGDDVKASDTSYTPLSRPSNLAEMTQGYVAPTEGSHSHGQRPVHSHPRNTSGDRSRGQRGGRGGSHRGGRGGRPYQSDDRSRRDQHGGHRASHQQYPPNPAHQPQYPSQPGPRPEIQPPHDPSVPSYLPPPPKLPDSAMHPPPQNLNPYSIPPRPQMMMPQFYNAVPPTQSLAQPAPSQYAQPQSGAGYIHPQSVGTYQGMSQQQGYGTYPPQTQSGHGAGQYGHQQQQQYAQQGYHNQATYGQGQAQQEQPYYGYQSMQNQGQGHGGYGANR